MKTNCTNSLSSIFKYFRTNVWESLNKSKVTERKSRVCNVDIYVLY